MDQSTKFERFFKDNYTQFYLFAFHLTDDDEASKDIVNDVFEYVWINYDNEIIKNWVAYTYSHIRTKCIDYIRHQNVKRKYVEYYRQENLIHDQESFWDESDKIEFIRDVIKTLPFQTQLVLKLCYFQNKKYKEAANELNISTNTIKKHIVRALKVIREEVTEKYQKGT